MNFLVKMVSMIQNNSIIWLILDQKRFTGKIRQYWTTLKIRIEFYNGANLQISSNSSFTVYKCAI